MQSPDQIFVCMWAFGNGTRTKLYLDGNRRTNDCDTEHDHDINLLHAAAIFCFQFDSGYWLWMLPKYAVCAVDFAFFVRWKIIRENSNNRWFRWSEMQSIKQSSSKHCMCIRWRCWKSSCKSMVIGIGYCARLQHRPYFRKHEIISHLPHQ